MDASLVENELQIIPKNSSAAVTICATNYLAKALVLRASYLEFHPDSDFYILLIDKKNANIKERFPEISILWVEELGIEGFLNYAFKFDVIELSTDVKPTVLRQLLLRYDFVIYMDPDIKVYSYMRPVFESLQHQSVVVTPHAMTPVLDGKNPSDEDFARFGSFNLGFVGVSKCDEAFMFLDWWSERCLKLGFYEPQLGLAVDQKWVDLAPCFFPNLKILRDSGLNVAFWNLHERMISQRDGVWFINELEPLYFFHYSSFMIEEPHGIAHKQSRFLIGNRPDIHQLLDEYAACLADENDKKYSKADYSFDYFDDGTYITPTLRRFFAALEDKFNASENPFPVNSTVYSFALKHRLSLKNYHPMKRYTFRDSGEFSTAMRIINYGLYILLKVIGPNRYFLFMKYLTYISSIRNQRAVIKHI
jgi:hypothetical protein